MRSKTLLRSIDDEIAHFETELVGLEAEQDRIKQAIEDAARAREEEEEDGESAGDGGSGAWVRPVPGAVTSPFGPRLHPILGYTRMHTGVDFSAPYGQDIRAAASGVVIMATSFGTEEAVVMVSGISPGGMTAGTTIAATITGSRFAAGADVDFENGSGPAPSASNVGCAWRAWAAS